MKKKTQGAAAPQKQPSILSAVQCAADLMQWITKHVYYTPLRDFRTALGAVWLSFCFDHDLNPFTELHEIVETFPFGPALGTVVPEWARSAVPQAPPPAPAPAAGRGGG